MDALLAAGWRARVREDFSIRADGRDLVGSSMRRLDRATWADGDVRVRLVETQAPDGSWSVEAEVSGVGSVEAVCLLDLEVEPGTSVRNHVWMNHRGMQRSTALFARDPGATGAFACYANPFGEAAIDEGRVRLSYRPGLIVEGTFVSDPLVVGPVRRTGREQRVELLAGRDTVGGEIVSQVRSMSPHFPVSVDAGEAMAVRRAVAARVPWDEPWARVSHWDWGENAYRLAIPERATREVYDRMAQLCAELGVEITVLSPAPRTGVDIYERGPWQYLMFLAQGIEVSEGTWSPGTTPPGLEEVLASFRDRGVSVAVYTNPLVDFLRRDEWRHAPAGVPAGTDLPPRICLAAPGAGEWYADAVGEMCGHYGVDGVTLDFVSWHPCGAAGHRHVDPSSSPYAQWDGYRRVLASLAEQGRSWREALLGSAQVLPWGARHMTHPHPVLSDNQPQWVPAWPDLSQDRANAHYQRRVAWWLRNLAFVPTYKIPGQVGHQANRRRYFPSERGWDWEGARFNLLSSIGSAPCSSVLCFLPCWDQTEWAAMRERDAAFFRRWLDFAKEHAVVLSRMEDLYDDARPGAVDGTIALGDDGRGLVFLANPDYVPHVAQVPVADGFLLRELHPVEGRLWRRSVTIDRNEVAVLAVVSDGDVERPALLGALGAVDDHGRVVSARGTPGTTAETEVLLAGGGRLPRCLAFESDGVSPTLDGWLDDAGAPVDLRTADGLVRATARWIPGLALAPLLRSLAPPIAPVGDEALQPWSDPSRLRLFPQILDPRGVAVRVWVDGEAAPVQQAYIGTFADVHDAGAAPHNLLGHYVDLTERLDAAADPERPWVITVEIDGLRPGHWLGMHVAHLPPRVTDRWRVVA